MNCVFSHVNTHTYVNTHYICKHIHTNITRDHFSLFLVVDFKYHVAKSLPLVRVFSGSQQIQPTSGSWPYFNLSRSILQLFCYQNLALLESRTYTPGLKWTSCLNFMSNMNTRCLVVHSTQNLLYDQSGNVPKNLVVMVLGTNTIGSYLSVYLLMYLFIYLFIYLFKEN